MPKGKESSKAGKITLENFQKIIATLCVHPNVVSAAEALGFGEGGPKLSNFSKRRVWQMIWFRFFSADGSRKKLAAKARQCPRAILAQIENYQLGKHDLEMLLLKRGGDLVPRILLGGASADKGSVRVINHGFWDTYHQALEDRFAAGYAHFLERNPRGTVPGDLNVFLRDIQKS